MKFLLDVCSSSRSLRALLIRLGHDVRLVGEGDPCASDETVLALAHQEGRIVVTSPHYSREFVTKLSRRQARRARGAARKGGILNTVC
jgi:predicted nuclease of predicted toxin-antitoxin system